MKVLQLHPIATARRSAVEPHSGLLSGTGAHTLTLTVCGSPDTEMHLAERGFVTALLDCARTHGADISTLDPLRDATGRIPGPELAAMLHQLRRLLNAAGTELGWALFASSTDQPRTYSRALIPTANPTVLLATPTCTIAVDPDGLRLRLRGLTIIGWHRDADHIVLHTTGREYLLRTTTISAALLHRLAHGHTHATLVRRPLADLATPLLAGLDTAATLAADRGLPLLLGSRPPEPIPDRVNDEPAAVAPR